MVMMVRSDDGVGACRWGDEGGGVGCGVDGTAGVRLVKMVVRMMVTKMEADRWWGGEGERKPKKDKIGSKPDKNGKRACRWGDEGGGVDCDMADVPRGGEDVMAVVDLWCGDGGGGGDGTAGVQLVKMVVRMIVTKMEADPWWGGEGAAVR
nr:hypothetical protein [Tanacetum cinerariifolium]